MRVSSLIALFSLTALLSAPALAQPRRQAAVSFDDAGEAAMIARINQMRAEEDLPPLQRHPGLDEAARAHSRDMARHQELVHVSERTGTPAARVQSTGVTASRIGENIAKHATTSGAFEAILNSPAHRAQLYKMAACAGAGAAAAAVAIKFLKP